MNVIIRTDASVQIGSGHVMRCLTVAQKLREVGCHVRFWMEPLEGNLIDFVKAQRFSNIERAEQADLYIVDHYGLGIDWEIAISPYTKKLAVIDDLAREHNCDVLLDQNVVPNYETRYDGKIPAHCVKLLGPKYLMIRDEFIEARQQVMKRNATVKRLLVFMGGTDPTNETMKILQALNYFLFEQVDVVVGNGNPVKGTIEVICRERGFAFHCQIDYMAKLMLQADFAIGAGGATLWERCYVGLPSSSTIVAYNQIETTTLAGELGVTVNLGWHEHVTVETYRQLIKTLDITEMSDKGLKLTATERPNVWLDKITDILKRTSK